MNGEWRRVLLYLGGMMGPLGTFVMLPMIPELRDTFSVSTPQIGWALNVYLVPVGGPELGPRRGALCLDSSR